MSAPDLSQAPSLTPPDGVTPNFVNPSSTNPASIIVTSVTLALMHCFVALRIYTRLRVTCNFGVNDVLCLIAAVAVTAYCAIAFMALKSPLGPHQWNVPLSAFNIPTILKDVVLSICLYTVAAMFLKLSLLALYLRIFRPAKGAKTVIWSSLAVIVLFYVSCLIGDAVSCGPHIYDVKGQPSASEPYNPDKGCSIPQRPLWTTMGLFGIISDFYLLAIPVGLTLNVRLPPKIKTEMCCVFLTGLLACVFSILSTVYRFQLYVSSDITWLSPLTYAFTAAELNIGVCCSCMPIVAILIRKAVSWNSLAKLFTLRRKDNKNNVPNDLAKGFSDGQLPRPPQAARIGLRSLVRKSYHPESGRGNQISMYSELESIDEDYHTHLRKGSSSTPSPRHAHFDSLQAPLSSKPRHATSEVIAHQQQPGSTHLQTFYLDGDTTPT